ncbi:protein mono-ADP-ribosyltransferase PARP12-like [Schistocerca piceifrons]|uniref:protein mono-ADP-ribosyltransferase PARP12-like n=1 Tax=Schistocerca piceifrons TaxID=274613 RepID=UPI001F5EE105|nr:protein mono-ADP-ribosyltransferase PARP12-like [Schistocerca piceifrons]
MLDSVEAENLLCVVIVPGDSAMTELALKHLHPNWTYKCSDEVEVEEIGTFEKKRITHSMPSDLKVTSVVKVMNPYLWSCYQLKKAEYMNRYGSVTEKTLYHATSKSNIDSIIRSNLDWRRSCRIRFGQGVSFSPSPSYANTYCNRRNGIYRAMIAATVLVNNTAEGNSWTTLPPTDIDTTVGNSLQVYVKYSDNEFYPQYVIYYNI